MWAKIDKKMTEPGKAMRSDFTLLFLVMLTIAAGNTGLQSILPAIGRSLNLADSAVAAAFSISALIWTITAPFWARRSERHGRRNMLLLGLGGFVTSLTLSGLILTAGILGWLSPLATFGALIVSRLIYGSLGSAAPPAAQAIVAGRTGLAERTRALTLLSSAFGLGTIIGPALAPFFILPYAGLAGPPYIFAAVGVLVFFAVLKSLRNVRSDGELPGAMSSYPSIGGQSTGATVTAVTGGKTEQIGWRDPRILAWILVGLIAGHAQAMAGQAIGFLVIDRLALPLNEAQQAIGIVLMVGAGAALLAQWGLIPLLNLVPRQLVLWGCLLSGTGCIAMGFATSLYGLATTFALACLGFGFVRPGFTAGASLAVGGAAQSSVAGKVTSINGAAFILGPSIGVGFYEIWQPLPYFIAGATMLLLCVYGLVKLTASHPWESASLEQ